MAGDASAPRPTRLERQAYRMVMLMADDPGRYRAKIARWIARDPATREALYNRIAVATNAAAWDWKHSAPRRRVVLRRRNSATLWTIGGVGALGAATAIVLFAASRSDLAHWFGQPATFAYAEPVHTRVGEVRTIRLKDGTSVLVDTGSLLQVHFNRRERSVELVRGRARFEVAHDASWPFVVYAGGGSVVAKGTVFVVAVEKKVRVHLISGSVVVRFPPRADRAAVPPQQLHKGQQTVFEPDMETIPPAPVQAKPAEEQWVTGMRTFDGETVQDVIDEVNRYTDRKIVLESPDLASRKVFLDLHIRDAAESAQDLADQLGIIVDMSNPDVILLRQAG